MVCSDYTKQWLLYLSIICTRGEGGRRPPSPLVRVVGATLISREEGVSSDIIELSVYYFYIKSKLIVNAIL